MKGNRKADNNPVALVTGGSKRLGKAICIELAKRGFDIIINYNNSYKEAKSLSKEIQKCEGIKAIYIKADLTSGKQIKKMVEIGIKKFGHIDLLVNNSAVFFKSTIRTTSENIWDQTLNINLKGAFFCSQEVAKYMIKQKKGQIINIASLGGIKPFSNYVPYSVSKAGLIMLTKCLAKSLSPYILVNAVAPGTIIFKQTQVKNKQKNKKNLLNKYGNPTDIADMVAFLATNNRHITGQVFSIDGGSSII